MSKLIVQFLHPGKEQIVSSSIHKGGIIAPYMPWNYGDHRRKFICQPGKYIDNNGSLACSDNMYFWGEWESPSNFYKFPSSAISLPTYCHNQLIVGKVTPYTPTPHPNLQNTDPYVFGDSFKYAICQQKGQLKTLDKGSIIMFGSSLGGNFVLDTVFVVADWIDYQIKRKKLTVTNGSSLTRTYYDAVLNPYAYSAGYVSNRIYFGATPNNMVDGMYSFVPCSLTGQFARPIILPSRIPVTGNLRQGRKFIDANTTVIWKELVQITQSAHLELGVFIKEP